MYTRQNGRVFPPLDVAQEYRAALAKPLSLKEDDEVTLEIVSAEKMTSGVVAGVQFQGTWPLLEMREPFRQTKAAGPVCRVAWSEREVICTGNQKKFDPQWRRRTTRLSSAMPTGRSSSLPRSTPSTNSTAVEGRARTHGPTVTEENPEQSGGSPWGSCSIFPGALPTLPTRTHSAISTIRRASSSAWSTAPAALPTGSSPGDTRCDRRPRASPDRGVSRTSFGRGSRAAMAA